MLVYLFGDSRKLKLLHYFAQEGAYIDRYDYDYYEGLLNIEDIEETLDELAAAKIITKNSRYYDKAETNASNRVFQFIKEMNQTEIKTEGIAKTIYFISIVPPKDVLIVGSPRQALDYDFLNAIKKPSVYIINKDEFIIRKISGDQSIERFVNGIVIHNRFNKEVLNA